MRNNLFDYDTVLSNYKMSYSIMNGGILEFEFLEANGNGIELSILKG